MHVVEEDGGKRRQEKRKIDLYECKLCYNKALHHDILDCLWFICLWTLPKSSSTAPTWIIENMLRSGYDETNLPKGYHPKSEDKFDCFQ